MKRDTSIAPTGDVGLVFNPEIGAGEIRVAKFHTSSQEPPSSKTYVQDRGPLVGGQERLILGCRKQHLRIILNFCEAWVRPFRTMPQRHSTIHLGYECVRFHDGFKLLGSSGVRQFDVLSFAV